MLRPWSAPIGCHRTPGTTPTIITSNTDWTPWRVRCGTSGMVDRVDIGDWCTLYHADSTEIIDVLREHEPDAVIMDPPYGIGLHRAGVGGPKVDARTPATLKARGSPRIHGDQDGPVLASWMEFAQVVLWGADHLRTQLPNGGRFLAWDKLCGREPYDSFGDGGICVAFAQRGRIHHQPQVEGVGYKQGRGGCGVCSPPPHTEARPRHAVVHPRVPPRSGSHHPRPLHGQRHDRNRSLRDGHEVRSGSILSEGGSMPQWSASLSGASRGCFLVRVDMLRVMQYSSRVRGVVASFIVLVTFSLVAFFSRISMIKQWRR